MTFILHNMKFWAPLNQSSVKLKYNEIENNSSKWDPLRIGRVPPEVNLRTVILVLQMDVSDFHSRVVLKQFRGVYRCLSFKKGEKNLDIINTNG